MNGRCGDQFFQYAFARKVQIGIGNNEPLQLNFYNQERWKKKINDSSFRNDLERFHIVNNYSFISEVRNIERFGSKKQKRLLKKYYFFVRVANKLSLPFIAKVYQIKLQRNGIYHDDEFFSFYKYPKAKCDVFIRGYFEDYHYYEDTILKNHLIKELTPKVVGLENRLLLKAIKNSNSVCVSVRSWSEVEQFDNVYKSRFICDKDYFMHSMKIMKDLYPDCTFVIFSDNIEFAKRIINESYEVIYENNGNSIEDKIVLMSSCKHFILSNSSFSWWIQYLSKNKDKTIISPNKWYTDKNNTRLINDDWILS